MSWLFSQALVEAYSEASSLDGRPSAPSNTMPTPQAFLSRDKTTDAWSRFPSGMTCEPLTEKRGEELLTWFRAGFLAPTYRPQSKTPKASTEAPADCGAKWQESSVRYDLATSSWKTARCLLSEDLPWSSVTLPKWGMMRNGELWERATPALPTTEKGSGSWVTPNARDWKDTPGMATIRKDGRTKIDQTSRQAFQFWRSPQSRDWKNASTLSERIGGGHNVNAPDQAISHFGDRGPERALSAETTARSASYNPEFAEWLMGWPLGWTDLKPLATDKFQQWQPSHGVSLAAQEHTTQHND
jgi:hypothetical protein